MADISNEPYNQTLDRKLQFHDGKLYSLDGTDLTEEILQALGVNDKASLSGATVQTRMATKTDTYSESVGAGTYTSDIPGLTIDFTPKYTDSKIIISVDLNFGVDATNTAFTIFRDGSPVAVGDTAGDRRTVTKSHSLGTDRLKHITIEVEDAPGSTDEVTYSVRFQSTSSGMTYYVNRGADDGDSNTRYRTVSTIKVQEIAA